MRSRPRDAVLLTLTSSTGTGAAPRLNPEVVANAADDGGLCRRGADKLAFIVKGSRVDWRETQARHLAALQS
jgi:hypothetical protein